VYYVKGDPADAADLKRAGIEEAASAVVFPLETTADADMKSILVALTIRSMAPHVRVVAEVNDSRHIDHFRRAGADELMVTSHIASRLLARSAIYPGLTDLVADLVASGGAELYGVVVPSDCEGLGFEEASYRLRTEHHATLVAVRRNGRAHFDPPREFELQADDVLVVIALQLGRLRPAPHDEHGARPVAIDPAPRPVSVAAAATASAPASSGAPRGS
jgi:voltage-gated potassium channel